MRDSNRSTTAGHTGRQTVFLHIGMSKAGSSAIQQSLVANTSVLADAGFCYPEIGNWGSAHHKILHELREGGSEELLARALEEAQNKKAVVLSCEGFWLIQDETIERLCHAFSGYDVQVILYLRRPSDYLPSSYRQSIKRDGETCTPAVYWRRGPSWPQLNYSNLLERWGSRFPIRVRAYEAVKHEIEEDFMRAIGAPLQHVDTRRRVANTTPTDGVLRLMLMANRYLPEAVSKWVRRWVQKPDWRLDFLPAIEDDVLCEQAKTVIGRWDMDVMREYVPDDDLESLLADRSAVSNS